MGRPVSRPVSRRSSIRPVRLSPAAMIESAFRVWPDRRDSRDEDGCAENCWSAALHLVREMLIGTRSLSGSAVAARRRLGAAARPILDRPLERVVRAVAPPRCSTRTRLVRDAACRRSSPGTTTCSVLARDGAAEGSPVGAPAPAQDAVAKRAIDQRAEVHARDARGASVVGLRDEPPSIASVAAHARLDHAAARHRRLRERPGRGGCRRLVELCRVNGVARSCFVDG